VKTNIFLYICFFILSCGKVQTPPGILEESEMVEILIDIHMAEGLVSTFPIHYDSSAKLYPFLERRVFEKHNIPDSVFEKSLEYYMKDVRVMDRIYDRVIDSLSVREKVSEQ
jgi:hypothetical protein